VGVEIGAVSADIGPDLFAGPAGRPAEEDAVLEEVDDPRRRVRLILGADVEARDDVEERQIAFFQEEDPETVVEDKIAARIIGRDKDGGGEQNDPQGDGDPRPREGGFSKPTSTIAPGCNLPASLSQGEGTANPQGTFMPGRGPQRKAWPGRAMCARIGRRGRNPMKPERKARILVIDDEEGSASPSR